MSNPYGPFPPPDLQQPYSNQPYSNRPYPNQQPTGRKNVWLYGGPAAVVINLRTADMPAVDVRAPWPTWPTSSDRSSGMPSEGEPRHE